MTEAWPTFVQDTLTAAGESPEARHKATCDLHTLVGLAIDAGHPDAAAMAKYLFSTTRPSEPPGDQP